MTWFPWTWLFPKREQAFIGNRLLKLAPETSRHSDFSACRTAVPVNPFEKKPPDLLVDWENKPLHIISAPLSYGPRTMSSLSGKSKSQRTTQKAVFRLHASQPRVLNQSFQTLLTVVFERSGRRPDRFMQTVGAWAARHPSTAVFPPICRIFCPPESLHAW